MNGNLEHRSPKVRRCLQEGSSTLWEVTGMRTSLTFPSVREVGAAANPVDEPNHL